MTVLEVKRLTKGVVDFRSLKSSTWELSGQACDGFNSSSSSSTKPTTAGGGAASVTSVAAAVAVAAAAVQHKSHGGSWVETCTPW